MLRGYSSGNTGFISRSTDDGETWVATDTLGVADEVLALSADSNGNVYAGTTKGTVFRSNDNGATWSVSYQTAKPTPIECLSAYKNFVYAGTYGGGLLESIDSGENWNVTKEGLIDTSYYVFTIDKLGYMYCGTFTARIFRTNFPLAVKRADAALTEELRITPNPASSKTNIEYSLTKQTSLSLQLYDCIGRIVRTIDIGNKPAGNHTISLSCDGLAAGVYRIAIKSSSSASALPELTSTKLVVLR